MERNKWSIQMQKIQSEIQAVQEDNKRLKNKLADQEITIQLIKKNVVLNWKLNRFKFFIWNDSVHF